MLKTQALHASVKNDATHISLDCMYGVHCFTHPLHARIHLTFTKSGYSYRQYTFNKSDYLQFLGVDFFKKSVMGSSILNSLHLR